MLATTANGKRETQKSERSAKTSKRRTAETDRTAMLRYTTIQLNRDYAAKMHVDGNNHGPSYIFATGQFTGGQLWIMDEDID